MCAESPAAIETLLTVRFTQMIKWKISLIQRRFNDRVNSPEPIEYESTILDLDRSYREIIEALPTRFLPSYIPPLSEPLSNLWQRSMALQSELMPFLRGRFRTDTSGSS